MRHQSAADASQQLHFDAGTCAGSGLGSGLGLQQHTSCSASQMRSTLCTAAVDPVTTSHRRCGACGTGRHVAARTEPAKHEDQSTCRDDEDLSARFASGVMPTSASYVIMAIIRHTRRAHSNSECTVRQVHGATHDRLGIEAVKRVKVSDGGRYPTFIFEHRAVRGTRETQSRDFTQDPRKYCKTPNVTTNSAIGALQGELIVCGDIATD